MPHLESTRYLYHGLDQRMSICEVDVYSLEDQRKLVICTEVEDNPGSCITHCACQLAAAVCESWKIDPRKLVWMEHNAGRGSDGAYLPASWEVVTFQLHQTESDRFVFADPSWRPAEQADWNALGIAVPS